eukprot:TRINITY_DN1584_c0_g1_i1.p1 TRINITY_DN1584_c0_g1~~TRINITY_DN1584_c0_g1_i1.p1  ORF type:complete len:455 (+),score=46.02 TRINITY_DN1584_c0_g1_i1:2776-4140(+)
MPAVLIVNQIESLKIFKANMLRSERSRKNVSQLSLRSEPDSCRKSAAEAVAFPLSFPRKSGQSRSKSRGRNLMPQASPSLQTAKCMLERANNLLANTRNRLAGLDSQKETPKGKYENVIEHRKGCAMHKGPLHYAPVRTSKGNTRSVFAQLQLNDNLVTSFDMKNPVSSNVSHISQSPVPEPELNLPASAFTLEDIISGLDLSEINSTLVENRIRVEDLLLLTKEDMKELGIPIYARNRILAFQNYFKTHKETMVVRNLLHNILKEMFNPSLIDGLKETETQKISIIAKEESPYKSPNEDKSLARLASELKGTCEPYEEVNQNIKVEPTITIKSQTPSFSARAELKFGEENRLQTERKTILREINVGNQCADVQEEMRDFHKEYCKVHKTPGMQRNAEVRKTRKSKENMSISKGATKGAKASDKHKEQLEKYREELESILGVFHHQLMHYIYLS